jgi:predicted O-methyltransferase YrrM
MNFNYDNFITKHAVHWNPASQRSKIKFFEYFIKKLVEKEKPLWIIETGTMWTRIEENAGAFTYLIGDLIMNYTGGKLTTVDISPEAIERSKENTKEFSSVIEYVTMDSVKYLKGLGSNTRRVDAFFLDSYDLYIPDPLPSEIHHFRELLAVYDNLSDDVMIGVDDNFIPGTVIYWDWYDGAGNKTHVENFDTGKNTIGKGTLIERFLLQEGWKKYDNSFIGENNKFLFEK